MMCFPSINMARAERHDKQVYVIRIPASISGSGAALYAPCAKVTTFRQRPFMLCAAGIVPGLARSE